MTRQRISVLGIFGLLMIVMGLLAACSGDLTGVDPNAPGAQLTIQAANAQMHEASLNLTQAVATEQGITRQTQDAFSAKATADQAELNKEATLSAMRMTETQAAINASGTQTAVVKTQAAADYNEMVKKTQTQYDLNEKDRRDRSAEQTLEFNTWAGRVALVGLAIFFVVLIWKATPWIMINVFGTRMVNGKVVIISPAADGGIITQDPGKAFAPVIKTDRMGQALTAGMAPTAQLQEGQNSRAAAVDLVNALPRIMVGQNRVSNAVLARASQMGAGLSAGQQPVAALPDGEIVPGSYRFVEPDAVAQWLEEVEPKLLGGGE